MKTKPSATVGIEIKAPPERVYDIVSDVTGVARWAAEVQNCEWIGEADGPAVGARFRGHNRNGWRRWSTSSTVTTADPGRAFEYHVRSIAGLDVAIWRYDLSPTESGCRVEERTWDMRGGVMKVVGRLATGVADRAEHNKANMERTLKGLKELAESD